MHGNQCNEERLERYLDGDLMPTEAYRRGLGVNAGG